MKAVVIHRHGGPEELVYEDIETPAIGPEDVLINLETVGLNHFDLDVCDGISGYLKPRHAAHIWAWRAPARSQRPAAR